MKIAIKESKKAFKLGEMPVGAVIVCKNKIITKGYNKKEKPGKQLNRSSRAFRLAALPGFEPGNAGIRIQCLTIWR